VDNVKLERFKRVAGPRVQKVLDSLDNLIKCANRGNYSYQQEDVKKMISAIRGKVKMVENAFADDGKSKIKKFEF